MDWVGFKFGVIESFLKSTRLDPFLDPESQPNLFEPKDWAQNRFEPSKKPGSGLAALARTTANNLRIGLKYQPKFGGHGGTSPHVPLRTGSPASSDGRVSSNGETFGCNYCSWM